MGKKRKLAILLLLLVIIAMIGEVENQTKIIRRTIDNLLYDNRFHYLPCEQLPSIAQVEKVLAEHQDVIQKIEAVNPGFVGVDVYPCSETNADITFWYGRHQDRVVIEKIIGGDTFYGVPYNLQNR